MHLCEKLATILSSSVPWCQKKSSLLPQQLFDVSENATEVPLSTTSGNWENYPGEPHFLMTITSVLSMILMMVGLVSGWSYVMTRLNNRGEEDRAIKRTQSATFRFGKMKLGFQDLVEQ